MMGAYTPHTDDTTAHRGTTGIESAAVLGLPTYCTYSVTFFCNVLGSERGKQRASEQL
jgi:hypothetical protein